MVVVLFEHAVVVSLLSTHAMYEEKVWSKPSQPYKIEVLLNYLDKLWALNKISQRGHPVQQCRNRSESETHGAQDLLLSNFMILNGPIK